MPTNGQQVQHIVTCACTVHVMQVRDNAVIQYSIKYTQNSGRLTSHIGPIRHGRQVAVQQMETSHIRSDEKRRKERDG